MADLKKDDVEYWHDEQQNPSRGRWLSGKPGKENIHVPGVVHECSTLYMGPESDIHAGVDENYTPYGCKNVYVTGGAIFPSSGRLYLAHSRTRYL
jgi:choline dehydrogenase-like flavoprotein